MRDGVIQVAVRMSPSMHAEIKRAAEANARSLHAEVIARLAGEPSADMLHMIRQIHAVTVAPYSEQVIVSCDNGAAMPVNDWLRVNANEPE